MITDGTGSYSFKTEVAAGDAVAVFIDDDPTYQGITVTVSDGSDLGGIQVFSNHIVVRNDNGGAISIADMDNALGAYADLDIHYAVIGGNLVANAVGSELFVPAGHTFTPGGDVNATSIKILGTVNGGTNTFNIVENWNSTLGDWNADTSSVNLLGTGVLLQNTSATPWVHGFNNLSVAAAGQTTTMSSVIWTNQLTTGSGVLTDAASSHALYLQGTGNVFVDGGGTLDFDALHFRANNATQNIVGRDYSGINNLYFDAVGGLSGSGIYDMQGNLIANDVHIIVNNDGNPGHDRNSILNTNNYDFTAANLYLGVNGETYEYAVFNAGSSIVNINGDVTVYATDANGTSAINAGSSSWTVSGNWTNNDTFTAGTSTVVLDGVNQSIAGSTTFNNLTKIEGSNDGTDSTLTFDNTATQTITGTLTLNGLDADDRINLVSDSPGSQWGIILTATATQVIDYVDVTDSDASGSDISQKYFNPVDSVDGGNNIDWFGNFAPVVNATASDTGTEDTDVVYTHAQLLTLIGATDVDDADAALSIAITNVVNGSVVLSGGTGGAGTTFTFTPTTNFVGNLTFDYQVSDDASPTPAISAIGTASVALAAVNDAPTDASLSNSSVNENTDTTGGHSLGTLSASDPDAGETFTYTIVGGADAALFTIGGAGSDELILDRRRARLRDQEQLPGHGAGDRQRYPGADLR